MAINKGECAFVVGHLYVAIDQEECTFIGGHSSMVVDCSFVAMDCLSFGMRLVILVVNPPFVALDPHL